MTKVCRMCDVKWWILGFSRAGEIAEKSVGRLDREGIGSRKGLRLILTVSDLKSVELLAREGSSPSPGTVASLKDLNGSG